MTEGSIEIGGVNIQDMSIHDLMEQMAFVFQESFLFSDTIFNNIALGKPGATKEQVEQAAKAAQCHDFIMALPNGYQTKIGDGGVYLSGGEQQRVSIASDFISKVKEQGLSGVEIEAATVRTYNTEYAAHLLAGGGH